MATLVTPPAPPLTLSGATVGDLRLDDARLERFVALRGVSLNGTTRTSTIGDLTDPTRVDTTWLEPTPDLEPVARRIAAMRIRTDADDRVALVAPIELFALPQGQLVRAVHYTLTLAIGTTPDWHVVRWWLEPGGEDATLRADGLRFLRALHEPGELEFVDEQGARIAALRTEGAPFDPALENARAFVEEVAALEEWTGTKLPLPLHVEAEGVAEVARAAAIVRARVVPLALGDELTLTVRPDGDQPLDEVDTIVIPREIHAEPLGIDVLLGDAEVIATVEVLTSEPAGDGLVRLHCRLRDDQPRSIAAHLTPPPGRSRTVRRTLVGGAPLPPDGLLSPDVAQGLRQRALAQFLDTELAGRELDPALLAGIEAKWPV